MVLSSKDFGRRSPTLVHLPLSSGQLFSLTQCCYVRSIQGKPVIALPDRTKVSGIPSGVTRVHSPQGEYFAHFGSDAITSIRKDDSSDDELPELLRMWFGDEYEGKRIILEETDEGFRLQAQEVKGPSVWSSSPRQEIPGQYGFEFNQAIWNSGFVVMPGHLFLLVTLEKGGLLKQHRYLDHFVDRNSFQWQSQNRTKRDSEHGRMISKHREKNIAVHLYVRSRKLLAGKAAPFLYCGEVDFDRWEGDSPITVMWKLRDSVPESWSSELGIEHV
jgi:uncharacterized protein DUF3427